MTMAKRGKYLQVLLKELYNCARRGQTLPICTIFFLLHLSAHALAYLLWTLELAKSDLIHFHKISIFVLILNGALNAVGYLFFIKLYKHSVVHIFNKEIPPTVSKCMPSFFAHLSLLRPIEIMFRYLTHSFRVLPDIIVLGEVRCGTTSLCQHLAQLRDHSIDTHTPFCLWAHPELDHKETFFFVGHYFGYVTPAHYRMCFPLKITKWVSGVRWRLFGRKPKPFVTFDGCAQYLTSPTAPLLIAEAYKAANQSPPILIACIRNPKDQALSWWKYENNAMVWGEGMGLTKSNTLRSEEYPPKSINDALTYSRNDNTSYLYRKAEKIFSSSELRLSSQKGDSVVLPAWSMTWPGGQLSGIGRNSRFVENILRYESIFQSQFPCDAKMQNEVLGFVNIMPISYLSDKVSLSEFLVDVLKKVANRRNAKERIAFDHAIDDLISDKNAIKSIHRNAIGYGSSELDSRILKENLTHFEEEKIKLIGLCKVNNITGKI